MGECVNIPAIPSFDDDDSSLVKLQQLSECVQSIAVCDERPVWHLFTTSTQLLSAGTWTSVPYPAVAADSDGVSNGTGVTIVTQGYYRVEGCVGLYTNSTGGYLHGAFLLTAGANNADLTSGTTVRFGGAGGVGNSTALTDTWYICSAIVPYCLYPGDKLNLQHFASNSETQQIMQNTNYMDGRFSAQFTGYYLRPGP